MIFSYQYLLSKYEIVPNGIIHIGAHKAEESTIYSRNGTDQVLWIEGNPELIPVIQETISIYPKNIVFQALLSDEDKGEVKFNITNSSMSSSILELGTHKAQYPDIKVEKILLLPLIRFDTLIKTKKLDISAYNFVNIDIQGAELSALKGFGSLLENIDYIYTEINIEKVYEGCALLHEIDEFLIQKGFSRVELSMKYISWGDAFYIREKVLENNRARLGKNPRTLRKVPVGIRLKEITTNISIIVKPLLRKLYPKVFPFQKKIQTDLIKTSGEYKMVFNLLQQYKEKGTVVVFDIGANIGEFSDMIISHCNISKIKYEIHLFEPQEECIKILKRKFSSNYRILINPFAISNGSTSQEFYREKKGGSSSSFYNRKVFNGVEKIKVDCMSLDDYIKIKGISQINLVKIDTKGHELNVIKSAGRDLTKIDNIQFKYGGTYIDSKTTLKDVYDFLKGSYYLGKISSTGVNFTPYRKELEDFQYSNYLAEKITLSNSSPIDYFK